MTVFRDALPSTCSERTDSTVTVAARRSTISRSFSGALDLSSTTTSSQPSGSDHDQRLKARKPSPGLAARLKALGFGAKSEKPDTRSTPNNKIGRIPEDQINKLDHFHRANSITPLQPRGRAWSGTTGYLTPQKTGGSYTEITVSDSLSLEHSTHRPLPSSNPTDLIVNVHKVDMEFQTYRQPDNTRPDDAKSMVDTEQTSLGSKSPPDEHVAPPPMSKDTTTDAGTPNGFTSDASSYFNPSSVQRTGSIYTLSRASFASQLAQLTSLQLPETESLATKISAISTSKAASRALMGAAEQIHSWISKASEVISGLDGEDDVEWAAAGGREGLEEVDHAISRFEELVKIYVSAVESLQGRSDISTVAHDELTRVVMQVETILAEWTKIRQILREVKNSVEIAMEWEELWNTVLGDIGMEIDTLAKLVFEMEEKRHNSLVAVDGDGMDLLNELETIVDETPTSKAKTHTLNRFSVSGPVFPLSPNSPNQPLMAQDDSHLLALFARMQPLRASLDFLPMRLSTFHSRAKGIFPTACQELEMRREGLESSWTNLKKDAESLRTELGEDRWVLVFRGAGRQAQKMYESVERGVVKLREAVDADTHLENPASMGKKVEKYEAKKTHYGPAIERVLSIIEKGVQDRLTVNGEILRLHSEMKDKWIALKERMAELDRELAEIQADKKNQQLRDSVSSMLSNDRSTIGSLNDTPGSSPASSVVMTGRSNSHSHDTVPAEMRGNLSSKRNSTPPQPGSRNNIMSLGTSQLPRKSIKSRLSTNFASSVDHSCPDMSSYSRQESATPTGNRLLRRPSNQLLDGKPRWNSSVKVPEKLTGHNFTPLSLTTPSPHARSKSKPPSTHSTRSYTSSIDSKIPLRSPLSRNRASPVPDSTPSRTSNSRSSLRDSLVSLGSYPPNLLSKSVSSRPSTLHTKASLSALDGNRRASYHMQSSESKSLSSPARPASSMAGSHRISMLPIPQARRVSGASSQDFIPAIRGSSRSDNDKSKNRPPFRV